MSIENIPLNPNNLNQDELAVLLHHSRKLRYAIAEVDDVDPAWFNLTGRAIQRKIDAVSHVYPNAEITHQDRILIKSVRSFKYKVKEIFKWYQYLNYAYPTDPFWDRTREFTDKVLDRVAKQNPSSYLLNKEEKRRFQGNPFAASIPGSIG